ncbi:MAG: DUF2070 family protein [Candidatus Bathyarchaeota archaeon]|nr:MAG: DUF2070 family protein [Candidatus Bathyarchaeota archaeon]
MISAGDLHNSIDRAFKHYSSLFVLPSYRKVVLITFSLCITTSLVTLFLIIGAQLHLAFLLGLFLFLASAFSDLVVRHAFFESDQVYNVRRCSNLSMFSILLWVGFLVLGSLLARAISWNFWVDLSLIGFTAVCILRLIVLLSTSFVTYWRIVAASITQPTICLLPFFYVTNSVASVSRGAIIAFFLFSLLISTATATAFIKIVDQVGLKKFQTSTTMILKAFLANWMEDMEAPVEKLFENFGKEKTIHFSLLAFKEEGANISAVIAVSSVHPGPFKNVGSSLLPFLIQKALANKLGSVVAVPHGLYGHEFDLASQQQNRKVLRGILEASHFTDFTSKATKFVRTHEKLASASCQIFGNYALVTLTLAPETTEDLPYEVGDFILEKASKLGLTPGAIVNAHNSINGPLNPKKAVEPLKGAAWDALRKASKLPQSPFEVGAAKVTPREFSSEEGMGPGGICSLVIRVKEQTCAYITIDGNNMVSGLRKKILDALKQLNINAGEVFTTDTHVVNAVSKTARGYRPLGEAIPHVELINYIKQTVKEALTNMRAASIAWRAGKVRNVKIIGERQIEEMSELADSALRQAKKTAIPLFAAAGLLAVALLVVL